MQKAYDNASNSDMLALLWDRGLKGKTWRILNNLNSNLTAIMKTRFGLTREIPMEIGGKQGSRLTGRMFAKLMDSLAEELELTGEGFILDEEFIIAVLLWVDDVVSCVDGAENQEKMLQDIHDFALKHKLSWGQDKCKVMRVGRHTEESKQWMIGDMPIEETTSYKYLGDLLTSDGKNTKNLEMRKNNATATTVSINCFAANEVLKRIETDVLLRLHEKVTISGLLTNAESWTLNRGEKTELEKRPQ